MKLISNRCKEMLTLVTLLLTLLLPMTIGQGVVANAQTVGTTSQSLDATLETPTGKLFGTLLLPAGKPPFRVVLIIAGSGMTDRDGNTVGLKARSDTLRLLAEGLARGGIGSLRYDKRSVAKSEAARLATNLFETQVDDAARWILWLKKDPRFNSIGVAGHSEGALIGTIAAQRGEVSAIVLLAGAGKRVDEVLVEQMEAAVQAGLLSKNMLPGFKSAVAEIRAGRTVKSRPKDLPDELWTGLFHPRAQEYLISLSKYEPLAEVSKLPKLGVRVLVVQGTTDLTGKLDHATLLATAVGEKPVLIENMNHELKSAPMDRKENDKASEDPKRPLAPGLIEKVIEFLTSSLRTEERRP